MQAPPVVTAQPIPVASAQPIPVTYAQPMAAPQMAQQLVGQAPPSAAWQGVLDKVEFCKARAKDPPKAFEKMSKKELREELQYHECQTLNQQVSYLKAWLAKYWTGNPFSRGEKAKTEAALWRKNLEKEATLMRKYLGFSFTWTELAVGAVALFVGYHVHKVNKLLNVKQKVLRELKQYDCLGADGPTRNAACAGVIALRDELVTLAEESSVARWAVGLASDLQAYVPIAKPLDELPPEGKRYWDAVVGEWVA